MQITMNPMQQVRIGKLTLNIGAGKDQAKLDKGVVLLKHITGIFKSQKRPMGSTLKHISNSADIQVLIFFRKLKSGRTMLRTRLSPR